MKDLFITMAEMILEGVWKAQVIWNPYGASKKKIFSIYKMIPSENLLFFIKQAEWKNKKNIYLMMRN